MAQARIEQDRFFRDCIFESPIRYLLDEGFLTEPKMMDMAVFGYGFFHRSRPLLQDIIKKPDSDSIISKPERATPMIIEQVNDYAKDRKGVMIFASTINYVPRNHGLSS